MSEAIRNNYFSKIAHAEGISFLLLLLVAMPLKYAADLPLAVKYTGWAHGILFVWYIALIVTVGADQKWSLSKKAMAVIAGFLPLGTFWFVKNKMK
jgi:integral membrane protein